MRLQYNTIMRLQNIAPNQFRGQKRYTAQMLPMQQSNRVLTPLCLVLTIRVPQNWIENGKYC